MQRFCPLFEDQTKHRSSHSKCQKVTHRKSKHVKAVLRPIELTEPANGVGPIIPATPVDLLPNAVRSVQKLDRTCSSTVKLQVPQKQVVMSHNSSAFFHVGKKRELLPNQQSEVVVPETPMQNVVQSTIIATHPPSPKSVILVPDSPMKPVFSDSATVVCETQLPRTSVS